MTVTCPCGKRFTVPDEHAGKKVKCAGCGKVLSIPVPVATPAMSAAARPKIPAWVLGVVAASGALMIALFAWLMLRGGSLPILPIAAGASRLNVDNISAEAVEVLVDGASVGKVKPFEVGVYDVSSGPHDVVVKGSKGEVDRDRVTVPPRKTVVFSPGGRGAYFIQAVTYVSDPNRPPQFGGSRPNGREIRNQKQVVADFGLAEEVPKTVAMDRPGETARMKVSRLPPQTFTAAEAVAYLRQPREAFLMDSAGSAFGALVKSPETPGAREAILACAERDGAIVVSDVLPEVWKLGIEVPEERLLQWLGKAGTAAGHDACQRAAHAALFLLERGRTDPLKSLAPDQLRGLRTGNFNLILRTLPPTRAQAAFRTMLAVLPDSALETLQTGAIVPDAESGKLIDALIQRLPPSRPQGDDARTQWTEARLRGLERLGGEFPFEQMLALLADLPGGTRQSQIALKILQADRFRELAEAMPKLPVKARRVLMGLFDEYRARKKGPLTDDQVAFLSSGLDDPEELFRKIRMQSIIISQRQEKDERLIKAIRSAIEREPNPQLKKEMERQADAYLNPK